MFRFKANSRVIYRDVHGLEYHAQVVKFDKAAGLYVVRLLALVTDRSKGGPLARYINRTISCLPSQIAA